MANEIEIKPAPIQRNPMDAAIELCKLYYERFAMESIEEVQETFLKFYSVAIMAYRGRINHSKYLPKE